MVLTHLILNDMMKVRLPEQGFRAPVFHVLRCVA